MTFKAVILVGGRYETVWVEKYRAQGYKPYRDPLPYSMIKSEVHCPYITNAPYWKIGDEEPTIRADVHDAMLPENYLTTNELNRVHNKALNKLGDKLEYVSNLFEAWYERKEAYNMLGQCVRAIHTFVKNWKDPKYWNKMRKAWKTNAKDPTSLPQAWLLWQFAIRPLVLTIDDLCNLLARDFPVDWVDAASGLDGSYEFREYYEDAGNDVDNRGYDVSIKYTYIVKHGVQVTMLNPNAQLLNVMGMTTPLSTAASVIPWGWAVDYFFNLSDMLSNFEVRFPGIEVGQSYTTVFSTAEAQGFFHGPSEKYPYVVVQDPDSGQWVFERNPSKAVKITGTSCMMSRTVGNTVPKFKPEFNYPALGTNAFANLASAIALAMHGARQQSRG